MESKLIPYEHPGSNLLSYGGSLIKMLLHFFESQLLSVTVPNASVEGTCKYFLELSFNLGRVFRVRG